MAKTTSKASSKNVTVNSGESVVPPVPPVEPVVPPVEAKKGKKSKKDVGEVVVSTDSVVVNDVVIPVLKLENKDVSTSSVVEPESVAVDPVVSPALLADNSIVLLLSDLASLDQQEVVIQQQRRIKRRLLEKAILKVLKANNKATSKKQKRSGNRQPSGFIRPTLISDELASFLGKESGTELARTAVTNQINTYIKTNNLKDVNNGRQINADEKLSNLLKLGKDDVLTYFNLQKYMKHHFIKKTPEVSSAVL